MKAGSSLKSKWYVWRVCVVVVVVCVCVERVGLAPAPHAELVAFHAQAAEVESPELLQPAALATQVRRSDLRRPQSFA